MKLLTKIFWAIFFLGAFVILAVVLFIKPVRTTVEDDGTCKEFVADEFNNNQGILTYKVTVKDMESRNFIGFYTSHKYVEAYVDGKLIYELRGADNSISKSPGYAFNIIKLEKEYIGKELTIIITGVYEATMQQIPELYYGSYSGLINDVYSKSMVEFVLCTIIFFVGIIMILYYTLVRKENVQGPQVLYLGLFSLILGIWSANETPIFTILVGNGMVNMYIAFLCLMVMPVLFGNFIKEVYKSENSKWWKSLLVVSIVQITVSSILQITRIADFREVLWMVHCVIIYTMIIIFVESVRVLKNKQITFSFKLNAVCMLFLVVTTGLDVIMFYAGSVDGNTFARIGFLIYIVALGYDSIRNSIDLIKLGKKSKEYRELAYVDSLTGMKNRTAYERLVKKLKNEKDDGSDTAIIMLDLNDLKKCNDYFGHEEGDKYIEEASKLISDAFDAVGTTYRIGGDEFCVVIRNAEKCNVREYIDDLDAKVEEYKMNNNNEYMSIAHGFVVFDRRFDADLEEARDRADKLMYVDKRRAKRSGV